MKRPPITKALCREVAEEAASGQPIDAIAARHRLTHFVTEAIVRNHDPAGPEPPPRKHARANAPGEPIDPSDLGRIRRMFAAGHSLAEVADELGMRQKDIRRALERPHFGAILNLRKGERYVTGPTRCPICDAPLTIVPCRACRIRELIQSGARVWLDHDKP
ncbi:MAG: hypothetical protein RBS80_22965 [Thermoguttaceae bacterium]|jgi:hypothetical protein|nr:hypothetical protein [Thermoguttaceae bacterium]